MEGTSGRKLYVVATPIGHLKDLTYRAVEVLREVDLVLAENPTITGRLLEHYNIKATLRSFNAPYERRLGPKRMSALWRNKTNLALVSNAGTPCILDPGRLLVEHCHKQGIDVIPIPGVSALSTLLSVCGFSAKETLFLGFLPNKKGRRRNALQKALGEHKGTIVLYESCHRIRDTLDLLSGRDDNRMVVVGRELTKKHEELVRGSPKQLLDHYERKTPRGEFVLAIDNREVS